MERISRKSASQIIPLDAQNLLIQFGSDISNSTWAIGELAVELTTEIQDTPKSKIDSACGVFVGLSASRIADIRSVTSYYPRDVRDEYTQLLTFSHFQAAKSAGELDKSVDWLKRCVDSMDDYGGVVMPVDKLRALMADAGDNQDKPVYIKRVQTIKRNVEKLQDDDDCPRELFTWACEVLEQINTHKENGLFGDWMDED